MKLCEYCGDEHSGTYGTGRFCNSRCAHGFSTIIKRIEINEKVSKKLSGRKTWSSGSFKRGFDIRRHIITSGERTKSTIALRKYYEEKLKDIPYEHRCKNFRISVLLNEQANRCNNCKLDKWLNKQIKLELHHKDGNKNNKLRSNEELLCPNCHSYTDTWRRQKR